ADEGDRAGERDAQPLQPVADRLRIQRRRDIGHRAVYFPARAAATSARKASSTLAPSGTLCDQSAAIGARRRFHSASCSGVSVVTLSFTRLRDFVHWSLVFAPNARDRSR